MKRTNMLIFGVAGTAAAVLAISIYAQAVASSTEIRGIEIPFSVALDQPENIEIENGKTLKNIEIENGKTLKIAVLVESQNDAEFDLTLGVYPYDENTGIWADQTMENDKAPDVKLDKNEVKISKDSKKVMDLTLGREMKDSGASVIITVPTDAPPGTYMYMLEANSTPNAEGLEFGSGELFTVIVK